MAAPRTAIFLIPLLIPALLPGPAPAVDFAREIAPLFEKLCYECHGAERQKSDFRLDLRSHALRGGDGGVAIVPGKSGESPLLAHVSAPRGDDLRMPPEGPGLSTSEIEALARWIDAGAEWPDALAGVDERLSHWAWQPVAAGAGDETDFGGKHPVDFFLERSLAGEGLSMSPEADRRTLVRRLSFDLHGLPPSPEDVDSFLADESSDAWEKLVDRYLASPHYGERYARHWLDIAHYADTHGFERDQRRDSAWRYRDWVIGAFNEDRPYDEFLRDQVAGDVLRPDDPDAVVATGFLAAGPWDFVGQVETKSPKLRRAARSLDLDDMATQVMTATTAITVNCARCHDHKLDPVSQEEYYRLRAVFAGVKREERVIGEKALADYEAEKKRLREERDRVAFAIGRIEGEGLGLADIVGGGNGLGTGKFRQGIDVRNASVKEREFGRLGNVVVNRFVESAFPFVDGLVVPDGKGGEAEVPVSSSGLVVSGLPSTSGEVWDLVRNGPVASQHSTELGGIDFTGDGRSLLGLHANGGITFDLAAIRGATGGKQLRFRSQVGYFGQEGSLKADVRILVDGKTVASFAGLKRADGLRPVDVPLPEGTRFLTLLALDGGNGIGHDQVGFGDPRLVPEAPPSRSAEDRARLSRLRDEQEDLEEKLAALGAPPRVYAVVAEEEVPEVRVLRRGDPESPVGDPLPPGALGLLEALDPDFGSGEGGEGERRAALAEWITHPENPLTRRVLVNRLWYWLFGQGIVATPSDFGLGGGRPSHPELLDWLAEEFARQGGSIKAMQRILLTSAAYRQDSKHRPDHPGAARDAGNRLLWRQNPRRIEAESVRDAVLAVSGKLNRERGGPGFEDFDYKEAYAPIYTYLVQDDPSLWRRSIYRYVVRTTPDRFMTTLDCPDPANLTPTRLVTTTALQSLALYNNEFMLRQAGYFAERLERESSGDPAGLVRRAFALALARAPTDEEEALGVDFVAREGSFAFCRTLFNANEFVYVD